MYGGGASVPVLATHSLYSTSGLDTNMLEMSESDFGAFAGNSGKTYTVAFHYKRTSTGLDHTMFSMWPLSGNNNKLVIKNHNNTANRIYVMAYSGAGVGANAYFTNSTAYADTTSWHHLAVIVDTSLATAADRVKVYFDGSLQTLSTNPLAQNATNTWGASTGIVAVGNLPIGNYGFRGYICNLVVSSEALPISSLYTTPTSIADVHNLDGLVSWPLGTGSTLTADGIHPNAWTAGAGTTVEAVLPE